jgi:hypothetical protein
MEPLMDWVLSLRGLTCVGITPVNLEPVSLVLNKENSYLFRRNWNLSGRIEGGFTMGLNQSDGKERERGILDGIKRGHLSATEIELDLLTYN